MKKNLLYFLMIVLLSSFLVSCNNREEKFKHLSFTIPFIFTSIDVVDVSQMTPDKFERHIKEDFYKIQTERADEGIVTVYSLKPDFKFDLSEGERYEICAIYDFKHNPEELTINTLAFKYTSPSSNDIEMFHNITMSQLEPLLTKWGFEKNETLQKPNRIYYLKGEEEVVTIDKDDKEVVISKFFR